MARIDVIVLGAGIVGTSIALHLAKRGVATALIDRRAPGEETSYGNAGVIEGNTIFPHAFPSDLGTLLRIALKRAPAANYHLSFLPSVARWLLTNVPPADFALTGGERLLGAVGRGDAGPGVDALDRLPQEGCHGEHRQLRDALLRCDSDAVGDHHLPNRA